MIETQIIVGTHSGDFMYAKLLCESIRYFCGDASILLLIDGQLDTRQILELGNIRLFEQRALAPELQSLSGLYTKLQVFFHPEYDRFLYLDADTVLIGDILAHDDPQQDFVVSGGIEDVDEPATRERLKHLCFDVAQLRAMDRDFAFRGLITFNAGQFFGRSCLLDAKQVMECVRNSSPNRADGLFRYGDQGILNYLLNKGQREGRFSLVGKPLAIFPSWEPPAKFPDVTVDGIKAKKPMERAVIHFTKPARRAQFKNYPFGDILVFFYRRYYARFPLRERWKDEAVRAPRLLREQAREFAYAHSMDRENLRRRLSRGQNLRLG